jgi:hypothetical protein
MATVPPPQQTTLLYDAVEVGTSYGDFAWDATRELADAWRACMDEAVPADAPDAFPLGLLGVMYSNYMDARVPPRPGGMIYGKQWFRFGVPPRVGDVLTTRLTVQAKYVKRGRRVVELATTTRNQRGEPVADGLRTVVWGA